MLRILINNWWLFACRAVFALMFAFYVFFVYGANLPPLLREFAFASIAVLFGFLAFGAGGLTLGAALRPSSRGHDRGLLLLDGLGACTAGAVVALVPSVTLLPLVRIIGFWALFVGVCEILMARKIRRHLRDEYSLALAGAGSVTFGAFLLLPWAFDDHLLLTWLGWYALFSAVAMSGLACRLRLAGALPQVALAQAG